MTIDEARAYLKLTEGTLAFALLSAMAELRFKCCDGCCGSCDDAIMCAEMMKVVEPKHVNDPEWAAVFEGR